MLASNATSSVKTLTFLQYLSNTAGQSSYTFTSANLGTATSDRVILVCPFGSSGSNHSINSVTLGGNAMTSVVSVSGVQQPTGIYRISVPSGTTANIVVSFSITTTRCGIAMYSLTGYGTVTNYDTASNSTTAASNTVTIDTLSGGSIVGFSNQIFNPPNTISSVTGFANTDVNVITDSTSRVFAGSTNNTTTATNATYGLTYS